MKPRPPTKAEMSALDRAACSNPPGSLVLRANGAPVDAATRDDMLARCAAGAHVELELEVLAFEQRPGASNRNFVRFRDGALMAMGRSGVGTPFLRDHDQHDALARGGTIVASQTEKRGDGDYAIRQTVKLTAPWAVELALRGLLDTVSIGWNPTGATLCSVCSANFWRCSHMQGQRYAARQDEGGGTTYVPDPDGALVCERLYTAAELVETSAVNVPAVPAAHIESIRAALAHNSGDEPHGDLQMIKLIGILGLAASAGEDEIAKAVENRIERLKLTEQACAAATARAAELEAKCTGYEQVLAKQAADAFIDEGLRAGKIIPKSAWETSLRTYFAADPNGARELLKSAPVLTQVGQPTQSGGPVPADPAATHGNAGSVIAKSGGSGVDAVRKNLLSMGFPPAEADKLIGRHVGGVKGA